jgi:hypothetical protein
VTRFMKLLAVVLAVTMISFLTTTAHAPATPSITLSPTSGPPGTSVTITGSGFFSDDWMCDISSSPSGLISSPACTIGGGLGLGAVSASFTVANVPGGLYTVTVTGYLGIPPTALDDASGSFTVTTPPAPVGGFVEPVNKLSIVAPCVALFEVIATVAFLVAQSWKKPGN